jgi:hypothetical protein
VCVLFQWHCTAASMWLVCDYDYDRTVALSAATANVHALEGSLSAAISSACMSLLNTMMAAAIANVMIA